ncbi:unnamed protein product [Effrenium voratum]|nr:unnamed protein product [Effrenium voratum]
MLEEPVLAPSQGESFSEPEPWKQSLAALVAALGAVFRSAACPKLAEAMLPTLAGGLLCAAGTSPAPELVGGGFLGGSLAFHLLQARRSLAELLNTLLEEAPAELRLRQEQQLLLEGPGPSRLVESLCLARPDPKLHEMLLELLWRGLRRRDGATQGTAALDLLGALKGPKIQHQLRHEVSAEQLMDWGLDLSLDLSRRRKEIQGLACSVAWGGLRAHECMATFSAHSLVVEGFLSNEDDEQVELSFEVPWVFVQNPDAATARGFPLHLPVALEPLRKSGALEAALAELVSLPEAVLHIDSTVEEPKTRQIFEELNKLFQGLGCSQDETMRSNTFEESNTCFVTPTKTRPVPEEDVVWTPPPSQNLLNEASAASPKRSPPRESQRVRALAESQDFKESQPSGGSAAATVEMKGPAGPSPSPSQEVEEARAEMKGPEMASVSDEAERTPEVGVEPDKGESLPASKEVDVAAAETRAADISPMRGQVEEARAEMKELEIASVSDEAQRTPEVGVERASPDERESLPASKEVRPEAELISAEPQEAGIRAGVKDPEMSATTDQASEPEVEESVRQDVLPEAEGGQASPPPPLSPEKVKEVQPPEQDLQDPIPEIEEEEPKPEKDADQDLRTLSYKELSALAKRRGVRAGGKKAELLRRMQKWERDQRSKTQPKEPKAKPKPKPKPKEERARRAMPESPPDFAESPWLGRGRKAEFGHRSSPVLPDPIEEEGQAGEGQDQGIEQLPLAELRKAEPGGLWASRGVAARFSSLSSALTLSSWFVVDGNQCFLPTAAFLNADRSGLTFVSELREGSEVRSVDDEVVTVTSILEHPEARREIVVLVTRHGQLRVTKDHLIPVRVTGSTEIVRKPAGRIQLDDLVLINNAPSPVKKFREDSLKTRLFAVCFDNPNTRVAVYDVSTSPIQAYGNPNIEDPAQRTAFEHSLDLFSEAQLRQACEDLGMATDGGKEALLKRLAMYADSARASAMTPPMTQSQNFGACGNLALPPESQPAGVRRSLPRETEGATQEGAHGRASNQTTHHLIHDLSALTVKEPGASMTGRLRQACKDRSLPAHGAKPDLVERLAEAERLAQAEQAGKSAIAQPGSLGATYQVTALRYNGGIKVFSGMATLGTPGPACRPSVAEIRGSENRGVGWFDTHGIEPATEAEQAAAACGVLASVAKSLGVPWASALGGMGETKRRGCALPIEELRSACSARGLTARGSRQQLVGRLAALLAPRRVSSRSRVPASLSLSLSGLQAACPGAWSECRLEGRACGLPAAGEPAELAERLAIHVASQAAFFADSGAVGFAQAADPADPIGSFSNPAASGTASDAEAGDGRATPRK